MHRTIVLRQLRRLLSVCLVGVLVTLLVAWPCVADMQDSLVGPASKPSPPNVPIEAAFPAPQVHPAADGAGWRSLPLCGGEMTSLAIDPSNAQILYVGTRDAGVFKTTNGGHTWKPANVGLTCFPIRTLAIDPQHPSTLYAGTDYAGLWKSTDGGGHWKPASQGLDTGLIVFQIVITPSSRIPSMRVWAAALDW